MEKKNKDNDGSQFCTLERKLSCGGVVFFFLFQFVDRR